MVLNTFARSIENSTTQLLVLKEDGGGNTAELVTAIEAGNLKNEHVTHDVALELFDEVGSGGSRTTWIQS